MKHYVGIDLGTTNSAICSYDGIETHIWKSPEQSYVTPSAIYVDKRGNKYIGKRAYDAYPQSPDNAAILFKRLMGTNTVIEFKSSGKTMTPEECSKEILQVLVGYLPEDIRKEDESGTVVTVPAAFNQMQKNATVEASEKAGIGNIAIMQEPVAAVISIMRETEKDGMFLVYDLGGGTLDIAVAESISGRVSLLSHGGIPMCGGRDFDRLIVDKLILPWLYENFNLPPELYNEPNYNVLLRMAAWSAERAKIDLSDRKESVISLSETEAHTKDMKGNDIYLNIPLKRNTFDKLISENIQETVETAELIIKNAGLKNTDIERIVFVGGPTIYKPLRDKVSSALNIKPSTSVNPMTAVAEGAAIYAESIDWLSAQHTRKGAVGKIAPVEQFPVSFSYFTRTPNLKASIAVKIDAEVPEGMEFQIDSKATGWTSGRMKLKNNAVVVVALPKKGDNIFDVTVYDQNGNPMDLNTNTIKIKRTAATVEAIPASFSICVEVLDKLGGDPIPEYLVKAGDPLPVKGKKTFKAGELLRAGQSKSINFKIWEGEITNPITDNRFVGMLRIMGSDFDFGTIPIGAELVCDYEILDSGQIILSVSIPSIGGTFSADKNFYSRLEGQMDYKTAAKTIISEARMTMYRLDDIETAVSDPKLEQARRKLDSAFRMGPNQSDAEKSQVAMEDVLKAKNLLAQVRKEHLKDIRQHDLDKTAAHFNEEIRSHASKIDIMSHNNLKKAAQQAIDYGENDFENLLISLKQLNFTVMWNIDFYIKQLFYTYQRSPELFLEQKKYKELIRLGLSYSHGNDIDKLREVVRDLIDIKVQKTEEHMLLDVVNIVRA
jgi:molecular chaperone DnaK